MKISIKVALTLTAFVLAPSPAPAQSQQEQLACMNDAFTVCGHAIPDRDRVAACLAQNIKQISEGCRTVMLRYSRVPATRERVTVRN